MKVLQYLSLLMIVLLVAACGVTGVTGSGNLKTEVREIGNVTAVNLSGMGDVILTQGETAALTIEAEDNLLEYLVSEIRGDTLYLETRPNTTLIPTKPVTYRLTLTDLTAITVAGAANVMGENLMLDSLDVNLSGAGSLLLGGSANAVAISISGAGSFDTTGLISPHTTVNMTGSGSARVNATELLEVTISGAGTVFYTGSPEVRQNISGIGEVKPLG